VRRRDYYVLRARFILAVVVGSTELPEEPGAACLTIHFGSRTSAFAPLRVLVAAAHQEVIKVSTFRSSREVIIRTDDWVEAIQFYESVLGLPVTLRTDTMMGFETGSFCFSVEKGREHGTVFEFLATDMQAAKRRLVDAGCTIQEEDPGVPRCYLRDPYGMVFNLAQFKPKK
jgi:predicted enzyme related to lactoylglutathione lyase